LAIAPINRIIEEVEVGAVSEHTTVGVFLRQADRLADKVILRHWADGQWQPLTWGEMRKSALAIAARLIELGVKPGDRVILMSENRVEWLVADIGIQAAAAVTVPVYPSTVARTGASISSRPRHSRCARLSSA